MTTIALSVICSIAYSQTIVLDSLPVYEQSYRIYLLKRWQAERREFTVVNRKKWWYYLPSVGWSFRSPSVQANTGVLSQIDYNRTVTAARLESMDARYQVEFAETLGKIGVEYRKLLVRSGQLERERKLLAKLRGIQAIHNEAFNSQTMTPEEHLRNSYGYERAVSEVQAKESELVVSVLDFQALCRYKIPDQQLVPVAGGNTTVSQVAPPRH